MSSWKKIVVGGAVAAVLAGSGAAWAATGTGQRPVQPPPAAHTVQPHVVGDTAVETSFTSIAPCRIADTRGHGGAIASGATRSFAIWGTDLSEQGGSSSGCGIPQGATSVQVAITAVSAAGTGFLKAYAFGATSPVATFLNYTNTFNVSNGGAIPLCTGSCAKDVTLAPVGNSTDIVIDAQGYFNKGLWAYVGPTGTVGSSSRETSATHFNAGQYEVDFDRDVSKCAYNATLDGFGGTTVQPRDGNSHGVFVATYDTAGIAADRGFYLTVRC